MDENLMCSFQILKPSTRSIRARARNNSITMPPTAGPNDGGLLSNKF